ncbi:DNA-binding protein [Staphylococcus felis]|uniref:DNA-binding protein n=1 Tax=Staphylococcus felis TaxID=46127 RepID=UPI003966BC35
MTITKFLRSIILVAMGATCILMSPMYASGKSVLVDHSHGQTAGSADWVIDGAFSDYADAMTNSGYAVKHIDGVQGINEETLSNTQTLIIPEANIPMKTAEQNAMINFVQNGGSVLFIADHYNADRNLNRLDSSEIFNGYRRGAYGDMTIGMTDKEKQSDMMQGVASSDWLSINFGVRFRYNAIGNITTDNIVDSREALGITKGVHSVAMHAGSTLAITDPQKAKGIIYLPQLNANQKWNNAVDEGIYNGGGKAEGAYVAISKVGKGKAAFIGDSSMVEDSTPKYKREDSGADKKTYDGFKEADHQTLLMNLTQWLSQQENYTSFDTKGVTLDQPTPLKDNETPAQSIEPQKEPWSKPQEGYLWYDRSTFAAGSYGAKASKPSNTTNATSQKYYFVLPEVIQSDLPFQIRIQTKSNIPHSTAENLKVGIYTKDGQQVGQISNQSISDIPFGYSTPFSIQTNDTGFGEKTLNVNIKKGVSGKAFIRLKKNDKTIQTEPITIE